MLIMEKYNLEKYLKTKDSDRIEYYNPTILISILGDVTSKKFEIIKNSVKEENPELKKRIENKKISTINSNAGQLNYQEFENASSFF